VGDDTATTEELAEFFVGYNQTFAAISRREIDDARAMLAYYGMPVVLTGDESVTVIEEPDALAAMIAATAEELASRDYDRSDRVGFAARVLNDRTAEVDIDFVRVDRHGAEMGRLRTHFTVVRRDEGWRIAVLAAVTR
jgi:hypothetical protein